MQNKVDDNYMNLVHCSAANKWFKTRPEKHMGSYSMKELLINMKKVEIIIIGINKKDESSIDANTPEGRKKWANVLNSSIVAKIKENVKNAKYIVWVGSGHASKYTTEEGNDINGIAEMVKIPSIHIYEDKFNEIKFPNDRKILKQVKYQIFENGKPSKTTKESHYADYLVSIDAGFPETGQSVASINIISNFLDESEKKQTGIDFDKNSKTSVTNELEDDLIYSDDKKQEESVGSEEYSEGSANESSTPHSPSFTNK